MQIVIDIPDKYYKMIIDEKSEIESLTYPEEDAFMPDLAIINGTPLPKGHGRLKDENEIKRMIEESKVDSEHSKTFAENIIRFAPTIIEADKAESEDRE